MPTYELCLDAPIAAVVDRIADRAVEVEPRLPRAVARDLADLVLRTRVSQTVICGLHRACRPVGAPVFGGEPAPVPPYVRPCRLKADDVHELPRMFAAAAADHARPERHDRPLVARALAAVFRTTLAPMLRENPCCGIDPACDAEVTDPFCE